MLQKHLASQNQHSSYRIKANLSKAYALQSKMEKLLESTKLSQMAEAKHDKLYGMFCEWV